MGLLLSTVGLVEGVVVNGWVGGRVLLSTVGLEGVCNNVVRFKSKRAFKPRSIPKIGLWEFFGYMYHFLPVKYYR